MIADQEQRREVFRRLIAGRGPATRIALVGASGDPEKYGNIILRNLRAKGYTVLPVNPRGGEIEGLAAHASLAAVPPPVDLASVVTPPAASRRVLRDAEALGLPLIWFQDGAYDEELRAELARARILGILEACVMVVTAWTEVPG